MEKTKNLSKIILFALVLTIFVLEALSVRSENICPNGKFLGGEKLPCKCGTQTIEKAYTSDVSGRVYTVYWCCDKEVKTTTSSNFNNIQDTNPCPLGCCIKQTECVPIQKKEDCGNNKFELSDPSCESIPECVKGCCIVESKDGTYDYYPKINSQNYNEGVYKLYCDELARVNKKVDFYERKQKPAGEECYNRWVNLVGPGEQLILQPCVKDEQKIIRAEATKRLIDLMIDLNRTKNDLEYYKNKNPTFADVPATSDYFKYIEKAYKENIVVGYSPENGKRYFKPKNEMTRAEMIVILLNSFYLKDDKEGGLNRTELKYIELPEDSKNHWASDYLKYALYIGLIVGYPDGTLKPDSHVTCKEYSWMLKNINDFYKQEYPKILNVRVDPIKDSLGANFKIKTRIITSEDFFILPYNGKYNLIGIYSARAKLVCDKYKETIELKLEEDKNSELKLDNFDLIQTYNGKFNSSHLSSYFDNKDEITCKITEIEISYYKIIWDRTQQRPSVSNLKGQDVYTQVWPVQYEFIVTKSEYKEGVIGTEEPLYKQYFEEMEKPVSMAIIDNNIFISDNEKNCIHKITFDDNKKVFNYVNCYKADSSLLPLYRFKNIAGIISYNNYIYVANSGNREILRCKSSETSFDCTKGTGLIATEIEEINILLGKKKSTFEPKALFVIDTRDALGDGYYISAIGIKDGKVVVPLSKDGKVAYLNTTNTPEVYSAYYTDRAVYFAVRKLSGNNIVDEKNSGLVKYNFRTGEFKELKHEPQITSLKFDEKKDFEDKTKNMEISVYTSKTPVIDFVFYNDYRIALRRALDDKGKFKDHGYDLVLYRRYPDWE